jgi:NAD-dependent dihydropyrimidine dehydrogenase PreA subunit
MPYVIAEPCLGEKNASCVAVCPVDCIYETDRMYVVAPDECIDCGACVVECPVDAIFTDDALPEQWADFAPINAAWNEGPDAVSKLLDARTGT